MLLGGKLVYKYCLLPEIASVSQLFLTLDFLYHLLLTVCLLLLSCHFQLLQTNTTMASELKEPSASQDICLPVRPVVPKSFFRSLSVHPKDEPFALHGEFLADTHPRKVNLGIGVYRSENGQPWPLPAVERAESLLHQKRDESRHEYLSIQGDVEFLRLARDLVFGFKPEGSSRETLLKNRVSSIQTVSGTGANRLGAHFLARTLKPKTVWIPQPTWDNHYAIWALTDIDIKTYPYYDSVGKCFDHNRALHFLWSQTKEGDVIVLHACAHNPTGADPTEEHWRAMASMFRDKRLIPFFDLAYQGFASGSVDKDAWAIRYFISVSPGIEFCVAQSFSKNFGLYGQRVGALHVVTNNVPDKMTSEAIMSNLNLLARSEYGMAPRGGSDIVRTVLGSPELRKQWYNDIQYMSGRIKTMRRALCGELVRLGTPGSWDHMLSQVRVICFLIALGSD